MLTKLRIQNFKSLRDTGDLAIRPLTFLVGPNSSGKSSVLQFLLMLKQTTESRDLEGPLTTNGSYVQLGTYQDFAYRHEVDQSVRFELQIKPEQPEPSGRAATNGRWFNDLYISVTVGYDAASGRLSLAATEVRASLGQRSILGVPDRPVQYTAEFQGQHPKSYSFSLEGLSLSKSAFVFDAVHPIKFYDLKTEDSISELHQSQDPDEELGRSLLRTMLLKLAPAVEQVFQDLYYLGPLREYPKRFYIATGETREDVGFRGEAAVEALVNPHASRSDGQLLQAVNKWISRLELGREVKLEQLGSNGPYQLIIQNQATGIDANITEVGFGVSQVLPVIVEGFYAPEGSTLLLEHPEIHLHPRAQAHLGDLFIDIATKQKKTLIVETHSEHLLSRIRRRIAEEKLSREDVAIYYFDPREDGTHIQEVTLNDMGQYVKFPEGFFAEDYHEAIAHAYVIADRARRAAESAAAPEPVGG
jgi:predicted ATPase